MSEYWKSTPKYWCKHCSCYVRDTKLERQNHEATGKHQGALKRFLRDLHRGHEQEERDKERAKREIARLNGVVTGSPDFPSGPSSAATTKSASAPAAASEASLKKQREQLAEMGVVMPTEFHGEMAMPGQWTVTKTRVVEDTPEEVKVEARATGIRKREVTEEEKEEEEAVQKLFKRPRKWGRATKAMPQEEDAELDALLSASSFQRPKAEHSEEVKKEEEDAHGEDKVKTEEEGIKEEAEAEADASVKTEAVPPPLDPPIKAEDGTEEGLNPVVFKKRKPKNIRQK